MWFSVIVCSMARKQTLNRSQSLWSLIAVTHGPWPACFLLEKVPSTVECCWKWAYNPLLLLQTFEQNTTKKGWYSRFFLFCSPTYEILIKVPALVSLCAGQTVSSKSLVEKTKNGPVCLTGLAETRITLLAGSEDLLYQPRWQCVPRAS